MVRQVRTGVNGRGLVSVLIGLVGLALTFPAALPALAADYYVDPNYAGVNGAAYNGYTGAYNSVAAALGSSGVPAGASVANPSRLFFAPGTYNVGTASLSNSRNNLVLVNPSN